MKKKKELRKRLAEFYSKYKRKIIAALVITPIIVLVLLSVLLMLGIKVRFVIDDELSINLDPLESNFFISNKDSVDINLTVRNDNFRQCKSFCGFRLVDLSDNSVVHSSNKTLKHNEIVMKSFSLKAPGKGSGQSIFVFEVECRNIKSIVCPTGEMPKYKSSIITLNYNLTEEEKKLKDLLMQKLESLVQSMNSLLAAISQNDVFLGRVDKGIYEKAALISGHKSIIARSESMLSKSKEFLGVWKKEDYALLPGLLSDIFINNVSDDMIKTGNLSEDITDILKLRNMNNELFDMLESMKDNFSLFVSPFAIEDNPDNTQRFGILDDAIEEVDYYYSLVKENRNHSEESLNVKMKNEVDLIRDIISQFRNITSEARSYAMVGNEMLKERSNTSVDLSEGSVCSSLRELDSRIISENNASADFRNISYGWSMNSSALDKLLENATKSLLYKALIKVKGLAPDGFLDSLDYSDANVSGFNWTVPSGSNASKNMSLVIPLDDIYRMAALDAAFIQRFLKDNCNDPSFKGNISKSIIDDFLGFDFSSLEEKNTTMPEAGIKPVLELKDNLPKCCTFGECLDCGVDESAYPVLFIHGHIFNKDNTPDTAMNAFTKIQEKLQEDGFINAGELDMSASPDDSTEGIWGLSRRPVAVRASYYYIINYRVGSYVISAQKSERIENYALRLAEIIDLLKSKTGAEKVDVVAHSMGGLVAREYVKLFGGKDINKLITVNTPHHGISDNVQRFCSLLGSSKECDDMSQDSIFLNRLNSKEIPENMHVIRSIGCSMGDSTGDGIVTNESAFLKGANNYAVEGECTDSLNTNLHTLVLRPKLYPQTYELIRNILLE